MGSQHGPSCSACTPGVVALSTPSVPRDRRSRSRSSSPSLWGSPWACCWPSIHTSSCRHRPPSSSITTSSRAGHASIAARCWQSFDHHDAVTNVLSVPGLPQRVRPRAPEELACCVRCGEVLVQLDAAKLGTSTGRWLRVPHPLRDVPSGSAVRSLMMMQCGGGASCFSYNSDLLHKNDFCSTDLTPHMHRTQRRYPAAAARPIRGANRPVRYGGAPGGCPPRRHWRPHGRLPRAFNINLLTFNKWHPAGQCSVQDARPGFFSQIHSVTGCADCGVLVGCESVLPVCVQ